MVTTLQKFPLSGGQQVGSENVGSYEPSGLVVLNNKLYMASDNGYLMSVDLASGDQKQWNKVHNFTNDPDYQDNSDSYDFESITVVTGKLMIGVEGSKNYNPHIVRYNTQYDNTTGSTWNINPPPSPTSNNQPSSLSHGGMEAMTFVPLSYCPGFNETKNGTNPYYDGYFFAAFQSIPGYIYVYNLPQGSKTEHDIDSDNYVCCFKIDVEMEASDMCFYDGYLFVLFDGGGSQDELHLFSIISPDSETGLIDVVQSPLPQLPGWTKQTDFEALAISGNYMFLGVDGSSKLVWCFNDYNITKFV